MADQKGQQEPSMEEILASIRKIISEDDEAEKGKEAAPPAPPGESEPPAPHDDDDVLELTERVDPPTASAPEPEPNSPPVPPAVEQPAPILPEPETSGEPESSEDEDRDASVESVLAAVRRMGGENDAGTVDETDTDAAIDLVDGGGPDQTDSPAPFVVETDSTPDNEADDSRDDDRGDDDRGNGDGGDYDDEDIITDRAATAASQALSELAGALGDNRPHPDSGAALPLGGSNRTVEDLVREMLRPMLREWLDANLPDLVQRLVRKEIKEMVRRAEDR